MTLLLTLILPLATLMGGGVELLKEFVKQVNSSALTFEYSYSMSEGKTALKGGGTVDMQDGYYRISGDGLEIYCDGQARWTVDEAAMEAVVEACEDGAQDFTLNPALLLANFDRVFKVKSAQQTQTGEWSYILVPTAKSDISSMELKLSESGNKLSYAGLKTDFGAVLDFYISGFEFSAPSDTARFHFDAASLSNDFIITDLR